MIGRVLMVVALAACAACAGGETTQPTLAVVPETVAIGEMPAPLSESVTLPSLPPAPAASVGSTVAPEPVEVDVPLAAHVDGDRLLVVGDALLTAAAPRNGGLLCDALVSFGWEAEIDAEAERGIDFVGEVLGDRLDDGWDAVVLLFGTEIDSDSEQAIAAFADELDEVAAMLVDLPVVILAVPAGDAGQRAINTTIDAVAAELPNVVVVDWVGQAGALDEIVDDGELTDDGMKRLSVLTAASLGEAPDDAAGECLPTDYDA